MCSPSSPSVPLASMCPSVSGMKNYSKHWGRSLNLWHRIQGLQEWGVVVVVGHTHPQQWQPVRLPHRGRWMDPLSVRLRLSLLHLFLRNPPTVNPLGTTPLLRHRVQRVQEAEVKTSTPPQRQQCPRHPLCTTTIIIIIMLLLMQKQNRRDRLPLRVPRTRMDHSKIENCCG
eukprot:PhF_6_TR2227/c0_g1_i2/m.3736